MENIETIYTHLQDELSKELFCKRLLYNFTQEEEWIEKIVEITIDHCKNEDKKIYPFLQTVKNTTGQVIIYGAGSGGKLIKKYLDYLGIEIKAYCDADISKQTEYQGKMVIPPQKLFTEYAQEYIMICVFNPYVNEKIYNNLIEMGCNKEKIIIAADYFGKQYFDATVPIPHIGNGIFVDAGCYDLGTVLEYRRWNSDKNGKIYSFEPDKSSYDRSKRILDEVGGSEFISIFPYGLWKCDDILKFEFGKNGTTKIVDAKNGDTQVVALDDLLQNQKCSFIKMDIEGAELAALYGAEKTIRRDFPVLAISVYHKPEDIFEIPLYILRLSEHYQFWIRHYSTTASETILYAIHRKES